MPKTLMGFQQQVLDRSILSKTAVQQSLADLRSDDPTVDVSIVNGKARKKAWLGWLESLVRAIHSKRVAMSDPGLSPADVESLAGEVRTLLIKRRGAQSFINDETRVIGEGEARLSEMGGWLEELNQDVAAAAAGLESATQRHEQHQEWFGKLTEAPLTDLKTAADQMLNAADGPFKLAEARVNGDIPEKLRSRALARMNVVFESEKIGASALSGLDAAYDTKNQEDQKLSGAAEEKLSVYQTAVDALEDLVVNGPSKLQIAESMLNAIVTSEAMTTAQSAQVNALVTAAGVDAHLALEDTRNTKQKALDKARYDLLEAEAKVRADEPDIDDTALHNHANVKAKFEDVFGNAADDGLLKELSDAEDALGRATCQELRDAELELDRLRSVLATATRELLQREPDADPEVHPDLSDQRNDVSNQETDLVNRLTGFKNSAWYRIEEMEVAVPESIWVNFKRLQEAKRMLEGLAALPADLNDLKSAMETAEDELVGKLEEADDSQRGEDILLDEISLLVKQASWLANQSQSLLFDASRGVD